MRISRARAAHSPDRPWTVHYTPGTTQDLDYGTTTLIDQFDNAVSTYPDRPATEFFGRLTTYSEIGRRVRRAAARSTPIARP